MAMRLAWYTRKRRPVAGETSRERALLVSAIVAAHLLVLLVLLVMRSGSILGLGGDGEGAGGGTDEVIHYFDISPLPPQAQPPAR
jgi:hypothetical protein